MKTVTYILIGAGMRGRTYSGYALQRGNYQMVAVAEPDDYVRNYVGDLHHIPQERRFRSYAEALALGKIADFAMITTQDQLHREPALMAIEQGYDLMLEKPAATTPEDCLAICNAAEKKGVQVVVCHVLRYTPFARKLKELLDSGVIGKIYSVIHEECVGNIHYSHSYVRGNWRNSNTSSDMLLAKSCHDLDLIQWLLGSKLKKVQSFGRLSYFNKDNCPEGAPKRCIEGCPHGETCPYNAVKIYRDTPLPDGFWMRDVIAGKPHPTKEELTRALWETNYGTCVFQGDNNVVDHQTVNLEYENGETAVFTMAAFNDSTRRIHIMGTKGEIISTDFNNIQLVTFRNEWNAEDESFVSRETIDTGAISQSISSGHGGGDGGLMEDLWLLMAEGKATNSISTIRTSVENHIAVFAAEESRKNGNVVIDLEQYTKQFEA